MHDQLLWAMHLADWDDLILFMANAEDERSTFAFHTLEIISLMLREQVRVCFILGNATALLLQ